MKNKKSLGQHWLYDREVLNQIADYARGNSEAKLCLEIGPGLGTLTSSLLKRFDRVTAIEIDFGLAEKLPNSFPGTNLTVVNEDVLDVRIGDLVHDEPYVVAGNIPYYITSPIIKKFLQTEKKPVRIVLLMQREVAERLAAKPGDLSPLGLFVQNLAKVRLGPVVPKEEFTPPPEVDSQVVILEPYDEPKLSEEVIEFSKIGFASPRKKLAHNLSAGTKWSKQAWQAALERLGLNPDARAEDLQLEDWGKLLEVLK